MKIEIEFDNSYEAKMIIDGREFKISKRPGISSMEGLRSDEGISTLGGMVARELHTVVENAMAGWAAAEECVPNIGTWEVMENEVADDVCDIIS